MKWRRITLAFPAPVARLVREGPALAVRRVRRDDEGLGRVEDLREARAEEAVDGLEGRRRRQDPRDDGVERAHERRLGSKRVIQRSFNLDVPRARVRETTSMLRDRSER